MFHVKHFCHLFIIPARRIKVNSRLLFHIKIKESETLPIITSNKSKKIFTKVFARLFQKAAGSRGGAPDASRRTRNLLHYKTQEGVKKNSPVDCFEGKPSSGVSPLTDSLFVLFFNQRMFFYKQKRSKRSFFYLISSSSPAKKSS